MQGVEVQLKAVRGTGRICKDIAPSWTGLHAALEEWWVVSLTAYLQKEEVRMVQVQNVAIGVTSGK